MASGSQTLTTYYAKRIIGDTSAANAQKALLQTGEDIATDTWILHRTNRVDAYGIMYKYDNNTNGTNDKIELYGGIIENNNNVPTSWVQLDTGDVYTRGNLEADGGEIIIHRNTTTQDNLSSILTFSIKDTDVDQIQNTAQIKVYHTHQDNNNGSNMVIKSGNGMIIGSGEAPQNLYDAFGGSGYGENIYLVSDSNIYLEAGGDTDTTVTPNKTIADRKGIRISSAGHIYPVAAETSTDAAQDIGTSTYRFRNVNAQFLNGEYLFLNHEQDTRYRAYIQGTTYQHGPLYINVGNAGVDITQSDNASATNGITSNTNRQLQWVDSQGHYIARIYGRADTNGNCNILIHAGNWYGSTPAQQSAGLTISLAKSGTSTCTINTTTVKIGDLTFGGSTTDEKRTIASSAAMYLKKAAGETLYIQDGNTNVIVVNSSNHLYPVTTNTLNLGTSNFKWASVYATTFYGALSGNASTATKATQDGSGNTITSFYLPVNGSKPMNGELILAKDRYEGPGNDIGLDCRNSDIVNANGYFTADNAGDFSEAMNFKRSNGNWDCFGANAGKFWFGADLAYKASFQTNGSLILAGGYAGSDNTIKMYLGNTNEITFYNTTARVWFNFRQASAGTRITDFYFGAGLGTSADASNYATLHAKNFSVASSRLIKKNIISITEYEAKKILNLRPVTFNYIRDTNNDPLQAGLIAEEVELIFPHLVDRPKQVDNKLVYKGLTYTSFIPYLIKLAQMQQKEIDSLKNELTNLKNKSN